MLEMHSLKKLTKNWLFSIFKFRKPTLTAVDSSLKVINKLLLDFFPDQTNLTIVSINGKQTGYTFNYKIQEALININ